MWNYLYSLWRSVLRRRPREEPRPPETAHAGREDLRDELIRLLEERTTLQNAAASYREFGYDDQAVRTQEQIEALDRRIGELRQRLHRRPLLP
jgi:hypothetical protein